MTQDTRDGLELVRTGHVNWLVTTAGMAVFEWSYSDKSNHSLSVPDKCVRNLEVE